MINPPFLYVVKEKKGIKNAPLAMGGAENKGASIMFGVT